MPTENSTMPLVSIIIPVYNGERYMQEAIDSALSQSYPNIEIIVVNDGSTDDGATAKIAREYGGKIRYFEKENGGCASALNYGISQMRGEWMSWLSHDDKYDENKISECMNFIQQNDLTGEKVIVNCNSRLIDEGGKTIFHPHYFPTGFSNDNEFFDMLLFSYSVNGCALLINKQVLQLVGSFDEKLTYTPDFDYWMRCAALGIGLYSLDKALCSNRVHPLQVSVLKRDALRPEMGSEIVKIAEMLRALPKHSPDTKLEKLWMYSFTNDYVEAQESIGLILRERNIDTKKLLRAGKKKKVAVKLRSFLRTIYRTVFKKGMD